MPKKQATDGEKRAALDRAKREFPRNPALQELHYIRYVLEIEWLDMSIDEIQEEVRKAREALGLAH